MDFDNLNENQTNLNEQSTDTENKASSNVDNTGARALPNAQDAQAYQPEACTPPQPQPTPQEQIYQQPVQQQAVYQQPVQQAQYTQPNRTNEYIYNNYDSAPKKKSNAGKITLGIIASVLAVFVISVVSISAYVSITGRDFDNNQQNNVVISPNLPDSNPGKNDKSNAVKLDPDENNSVGEPDDSVSDKVYPTLEQLAAPDDAMGLPDIYDKVSPSVVGVSCTLPRGTATGTGIIISEDGYIITNAHVIEDAVSVMIVDNELNEYTATVIGSDEQTDLAVLKIDATGLVACEFGSSKDLRIGELAVVIGNPLGFELYGTMTSGIISGLNRTINIGDKKMTLIQTNASINNGNSGGPLINSYGQIIGVTSAKVASIYGEGLGFAIPIDEAIPIINDLMKYGYVTGRPIIGISGEDINAITALYYRLPQGVCVRFVTPDSGAEAAGIKAGDIIIGANGQSITTMDELNAIKNNFSAGDTITLTIYRDNVNMDVDIVLGEVTQDTQK